MHDGGGSDSVFFKALLSDRILFNAIARTPAMTALRRFWRLRSSSMASVYQLQSGSSAKSNILSDKPRSRCMVMGLLTILPR